MLERFFYFIGFSCVFAWFVTMLALSWLHYPLADSTFILSAIAAICPLSLAMSYTLIVTESHRSV